MTRGRFALAAAAAGAASCVLVAGCLLPYAYPKLDFIPGCDPSDPRVTDVRAFRVDVTVDHQAGLHVQSEYTITEITPRPDGSIPPQTRLSVERGSLVCGPLNYFNHSRLHATRVRLYSPGYQVVELKSWDSPDEIRWQVAADWEAREQAVDDLIHPLALTAAARALGGQLPGVTTSPASKQVFIFAAAEYEEVARLAPTPQDAARLRDKARRLLEAKSSAAPQPKLESP